MTLQPVGWSADISTAAYDQWLTAMTASMNEHERHPVEIRPQIATGITGMNLP